VQIFLQLFI